MRTGILGILFVCMLMSVSGAEIAIRQPEKPEWKIDLTDSCVRENGVRMADHLSRRRRTVRDDAGAVFRWSVSIDAPKQSAPHGFLLEFDNGDVVESLTVNGRPVKTNYRLQPEDRRSGRPFCRMRNTSASNSRSGI